MRRIAGRVAPVLLIALLASSLVACSVKQKPSGTSTSTAAAALSFIGMGAAPPMPSLGIVIAEHFEFARVRWTALAFPTGLLVILFLAFQVLGDGLRAALDPRSGRAS
ncbi:MAG: hypothetical protein EXR68_04180 [Dehalococcoidia bacterium]|nr:hypothetical protein [Dehalococcoidia bacterium]